MNKNTKVIAAFLAPLVAISTNTNSFAQETKSSEQHSHIEEVLVTGSPIGRSQFDIMQSTAVLSGDDLDAELGGNLGETLDHIPGISNSYFGNGVGRPIVRGLGGDRVRVLIGGIGSIDASSTSPDHAVAGDPLTAQSIEIIRGPATLLYGNNAVGGVINIMDGRIPYKRFESDFAGAARTIYSTNSDEIDFAGAFDVRASEQIMLHFEGTNRDSNNMTIPGFARTEELRLSDPVVEETQNTVSNSHLKNTTYSAGGTVFFGNSFVGMSLGSLKNNYGIPVTFEEGVGGVRIDLKQTRVDLMSEIESEFAIFKKAKIRFGWADYEHRELEDGEVGTTFLNKGWEGRVELVQQDHTLSNNWALEGAMGVQISKRNFEAIGEEAFVPPTLTKQFGIFIMEEWSNENTSFQLGSRIELQKVEAPSLNMHKNYTGLSFSGGVSYLLNHEVLIGMTANRTERNPNAEELFSNGPHIASQTYEIGDVSLEKERSTGVEISLRKREGALTGSVSIFTNSFDNFIYEDFSGEIIDELPVAHFSQTDVLFYGGELELNWVAWQNQDYNLNFDIGADFVRAKERGSNNPLPRIPARSLTLASELTAELFSFRLEGEFAGAQNRTATYETPTDGYFRLDSSLTLHPLGAEKNVSLILQARNITNEEIRYHTSFLKDLLPASGRDFRISLRVGF